MKDLGNSVSLTVKKKIIDKLVDGFIGEPDFAEMREKMRCSTDKSFEIYLEVIGSTYDHV